MDNGFLLKTLGDRPTEKNTYDDILKPLNITTRTPPATFKKYIERFKWFNG